MARGPPKGDVQPTSGMGAFCLPLWVGGFASRNLRLLRRIALGNYQKDQSRDGWRVEREGLEGTLCNLLNKNADLDMARPVVLVVCGVQWM